MKVLVINSGSSSVKYQMIDLTTETMLAKGILERIGLNQPALIHKKQGSEPVTLPMDLQDHEMAMEKLVGILTDKKHGVITSMKEIAAVGHRVVHGGERFKESVIINNGVLQGIIDCIELAPLHNPPSVTGINACRTIMEKTPMIAVFDTAFHQTLEEHAYLYPLPYSLYEKHGVRKYGFHGTSHQYVAQRAAVLLGRRIEDLNIVTCHLGNGASVCAVKGGKSVDTSMGLTPLAGLMMGTRCGDIDPAIVPFIMDKMEMTTDQVCDYMNKKSGLLGITEMTSDFREILEAQQQGDKRCKLALDIFNYKIQNYVAQYAGVMGGLDAVVFTAGIGENNPVIRTEALKNLGYLGIGIDEEKNALREDEIDISSEDATVRTLVIATDEELAIARECKKLI